MRNRLKYRFVIFWAVPPPFHSSNDTFTRSKVPGSNSQPLNSKTTSLTRLIPTSNDKDWWRKTDRAFTFTLTPTSYLIVLHRLSPHPLKRDEAWATARVVSANFNLFIFDTTISDFSSVLLSIKLDECTTPSLSESRSHPCVF